MQRLEKDLELDQWWCKKDSRISNWSKEYKVRGAALFVRLNCMILRGMLYDWVTFLH